MSDSPSAALDAIREREQRAKRPAQAPPGDVPRLLAGYDALLELHKITEDGYGRDRCSDCSYERQYTVSPGDCPVRKIITRALLAEDGTSE